MGLTQQGFRKLINMIKTHHRTMAHFLVCLTHESTVYFFERIREPPPWTTILTHRSLKADATGPVEQTGTPPP